MSILDSYLNKKTAFIFIGYQLILPISYCVFFADEIGQSSECFRENFYELRRNAELCIRAKKEAVSLEKIYSMMSHMADSRKYAEMELEYYRKHYLFNEILVDFMKQFNGKVVLLNNTCMSQEELIFAFDHRLDFANPVIVDIFDYSKLYLKIEQWNRKTNDTILFISHNIVIGTEFKDIDRFDINSDNEGAKYDRIYLCKERRRLLSVLGSYFRTCHSERLSGLFQEEIGLTLMGPLLVTYGEYILQFAEKKRIKQICPLLRDGYIMEKILNELLMQNNMKDISIIPLHVSRRALSRINEDYEGVLTTEELQRLKKSRMTMGAYLNNMGISVKDFPYAGYDFEEAERLFSEDGKSVTDILREYIAEFQDSLASGRNESYTLVDAYLESMIDLEQDVLTVDFGFAGTIGGKLSSIYRWGRRKGKIYNLLLCGSIRQNAVLLNQNYVHAFLYDLGKDSEKSQYSSFVYSIFENFMMGEEGTTIGYKKDRNGKVFPVIEKESSVDYNQNRLCHQGISDYIGQWGKIKKQCPCIREIAVQQAEELQGMMERVLLFPTYKEARTLGIVRAENTYIGQSAVQTICPPELIDGIKAAGKQEYLLQERKGKGMWISGAYAQVYPGDVLVRLIQHAQMDIHSMIIVNALKRCMDFPEEPFTIYGLGMKGKLLAGWMDTAGLQVVSIIDNNVNIKDSLYCGIPVTSLEEYTDQGSLFVISSCIYYKEIKKELTERYGSERILDWYRPV